MKKILEQLTAGNDIGFEESERAMHKILSGKATPAQLGGFLAALKAKGETVDEIAGMIKAVRERSLATGIHSADLVDICGTGGDGGRTFNISTVASIVAAAAGVKIAKHINRAVSSPCGSADVLMALGIKVDCGPKSVVASIEETGIGCMFGPIFNPTLTWTLGARRELGFMTAFDLLTPLVGPAGSGALVMGVHPTARLELLTEALARLDTGRVVAFSSEDGLDELSLSAVNHLVEIDGVNMKKYDLTAEDVGLAAADISEIRGSDADHNAVIINDILKGRTGACFDIAAFNAGAAIYAAGQAASIKEGVDAAVETIKSGKAKEKLGEWKAFSKRLGVK
ncbi:MAG: anthranilate phosphoribosyltransferase [FCB group bacterium]|nr:anthranilate phosphoribosyltransferase [FCB group bacterium]